MEMYLSKMHGTYILWEVEIGVQIKPNNVNRTVNRQGNTSGFDLASCSSYTKVKV